MHFEFTKWKKNIILRNVVFSNLQRAENILKNPNLLHQTSIKVSDPPWEGSRHASGTWPHSGTRPLP